ncbi:hypothetical protein PG997_015174 [Apiospora hydei]|uniref:Uncharacterized protein n=1 Tax=Apiospora hydei TaxID=1337664 RepID=A0ABR1UVX8_9PEZI
MSQVDTIIDGKLAPIRAELRATVDNAVQKANKEDLQRQIAEMDAIFSHRPMLHHIGFLTWVLHKHPAMRHRTAIVISGSSSLPRPTCC